MIRSPEIARQVTSLLDDISADGSYKLSLDHAGHIVWTSGEPGAEARLAHGSGNDALAALPAEAARAVRRRGAAVSRALQGVMRRLLR